MSPRRSVLCLLAAVLSTVHVSPALSRVMVDTTLPLSEVVWLPELTAEFVGTPSIVALGNDSYLASRNEFGPGGCEPSGCQASQILLGCLITGLQWPPACIC